MKVLLVDDHPLILAALKAMMEQMKPGVAVTAVSSGAAARETLRKAHDFDLMLLDLQLDDTDGFGVLTEVRRDYSQIPVVVISGSDRSGDVIRAIDLGAMGFLPKRMNTEELAHALRLVMAGGIFVPTMSMDATVEEPAPQAPRAAAPAQRYNAVTSFEELGLTPRQSDVLLLLLEGKSNKDIARRLGLSVETIKDHVQAVLRTLGVNSRTQAVLAVGEYTRGGFRRPAA